MQLIQDTFIIENLQVLNEGASTGPMRIKGVFGRCNEKNNNGRIYPTNILESQLSKVQPLIEERRLCGELDHPQNDTVKLSNASHLITKLEMKGNELIGEAELLRTPAGLTAQALINGGVKIGISSRGMGTLSEDREGNKIVNEDFRLVTFDLVADPSTRGAFPGLSESTESRFIMETQNKLEKECNFVTLMEAKLRDAYGIDEVYETEDDLKKRYAGNDRSSGTGIQHNDGPGFLARQRIKAAKRAEAVGDVQAARIRARGEAGGNVGMRGALADFTKGKISLGPGTSKYANTTDSLKYGNRQKPAAEKSPTPPDLKPDTPSKPKEPTYAEKRAAMGPDNAAMRQKQAERLRTHRANRKNKAAREARKTFEKARNKAYGKSAAEQGIRAGTEYKQIGKVLAESFGLLEGCSYKKRTHTKNKKK